MFSLVGFTYWNQLYSSYFHRNIYFLPLLIIIWTFCLFLSTLHDLSHFSNTAICMKSFSFLLFLSTSFVPDVITSHLPFCFSFFLSFSSLLLLFIFLFFFYPSSFSLTFSLFFLLQINSFYFFSFPSFTSYFFLCFFFVFFFLFKNRFFWQKISIYLFIKDLYLELIQMVHHLYIFFSLVNTYIYLCTLNQNKRWIFAKLSTSDLPHIFFSFFFLYIDMSHIFYQVSNMEETCRK